MAHSHSHSGHGHSHGPQQPGMRRPLKPEKKKMPVKEVASNAFFYLGLFYVAWRISEPGWRDPYMQWAFWTAFGGLLPAIAGFELLVKIGRKEGLRLFITSTIPLLLGLCFLNAILLFFLGAGAPPFAPLTATAALLGAFFYMTFL